MSARGRGLFPSRERGDRFAGGRRAPGFRGIAPTCLVLLGMQAAGAAPCLAQSLEDELQATAARYARARADQLDLISPRNIERAADRLARAQQEDRQGGRMETIRRRLRESNEALEAAEDLLEIGRTLMAAALTARTAAQRADAPALARPAWEEAENRATQTGRKVEDGDRLAARRLADEAESLYRRAELEAARRGVLGTAMSLRDAALAAGAESGAPRTLAEGDALLERADVSLQADPGRPAEARELASAAAAAYRRATRIAALVDSLRRGDLAAEEVVRRHEQELAPIAERLGLEPGFGGGSGPVAEEIRAALLGLQEALSGLETTLADRERTIRHLQAFSDSLRAELAQLGQREAEISAALAARERRERTLREVRALFDPGEADLIVELGRVTIRLVGMKFDSGSDEIRPADHSLLTKVQQAIRAFPGAQITVEGHTDSQGNDTFNQALSARRAIAVREYVLSNMAISADRIRAVGFGESRPVAPNETESGRAANRRIDIVLELSGN